MASKEDSSKSPKSVTETKAHDASVSSSSWKCPDPGCKKVNQRTDDACSQCTLPRHSAEQLKRAMSSNQGRNKGYKQHGRQNRNHGGGYQQRRFYSSQKGHYNQRGNPKHQKPKDVDLNNPIVQAFQGYAKELDAKNDRFERLVKLSRDITLESKRAIFALHRITGDDEKEAVLFDVERSLSDIRTRLWYDVAKELKGQQAWRFVKAYYGGLQEYVEALSFYHFHHFKKLITLKEVEEKLKVQIRVWHDKPKDKPTKSDSKVEEVAEEMSVAEVSKDTEKKKTVEDGASSVEEAESKKKAEGNAQDETGATDNVNNINESEKESEIDCSTNKDEKVVEEDYHFEDVAILVPHTDFIMGLADLTGEIMRLAINLVGLGDLSSCFHLSSFLHSLHVSLEGIDAHRGLSKKRAVLKQSLTKVEYTCYTINVRGSELNKNSIAELLQKESEDDIEAKRDIDAELSAA